MPPEKENQAAQEPTATIILTQSEVRSLLWIISESYRGSIGAHTTKWERAIGSACLHLGAKIGGDDFIKHLDEIEERHNERDRLLSHEGIAVEKAAELSGLSVAEIDLHVHDRDLKVTIENGRSLINWKSFIEFVAKFVSPEKAEGLKRESNRE